METPEHSIEITQGATFEIDFFFEDSVGAPVDLTGYTARMQVRDTIGGKVRADLTQASGIQLGGVTGSVRVTIPDGVTRAMAPAVGAARGLYDLFLRAPGVNGKVTRLVHGSVSVAGAITNPQV